jgi:hypothetical protein
MSLLATRASHGALLDGRAGEAQQFSQGCRSRAMHGGAHYHFDCLQVEVTGPAPAAEDDVQKLIYFLRDFLADLRRRFFSWSFCGSSSAGRKRQISALVSTNSRLSCWNLRNSATSRSAL